MSSVRSNLILLGCVAALSACGGSGSGGSTNASYPVDAALSAFYQSSAVYNLSATSGSTTFHLQVSVAPGPQTTFIGTRVDSTVLTDSIESNGSVLVTGGKTLFYLTDSFREWGGILPGGVYEVDHGQHILPAKVSVGDGGDLDKQDYFADSSMTDVTATGTRTWTMTAMTADTGLFCIDDTDDLGGGTNTEEDCFVVDEKGNVMGLQVTLTFNGTTLTFK